MYETSSDPISDDLAKLLVNDDLADLPDDARRLARDLMEQVARNGFDSLDDLGELPYRVRDPDGYQGAGNEHPVTGPSDRSGAHGASRPARGSGLPWVNIIPAPPGSAALCAQLVLAIAHKTARGRSGRMSGGSRGTYGRPRVGLDMALRLLRENLIYCGSGPTGLFGRTALLMTDYWDPRRAYESRLDLGAHKSVGNLRTACLYWDGARWHRQYP